MSNPSSQPIPSPAVEVEEDGIAPTSDLPRPDKVTSRHLERQAMIYIRQSTPQQMVRHVGAK